MDEQEIKNEQLREQPDLPLSDEAEREPNAVTLINGVAADGENAGTAPGKDGENTAKARRKPPYAIAVFGNPRALVMAGLLAAMSLILGKFLQIPNPFSEIVRISFENLPLILAGLLLGPIAGAMTGAVADLVGCLLYGYSINPIITVGAASVGLVAGLAGMLLSRAPLFARVATAGIAAHLIGSVGIKTAGLAAWYLAKYELGYMQLLGLRALNYTVIAILEILLLYALLRNRGVSRQLERMCKK